MQNVFILTYPVESPMMYGWNDDIKKSFWNLLTFKETQFVNKEQSEFFFCSFGFPSNFSNFTQIAKYINVFIYTLEQWV